MYTIKLNTEIERQEAFKLRARAYKAYLPNGTMEFSDQADKTATIYGVYDQNQIVGTVRVNHDSNMPCKPYYNITPPKQSVEISRFCIDPDIKNPIRQISIVSPLMQIWFDHCKQFRVSMVYAAATNKTAKYYASLLGFTVVDHAVYPPAKVELELMAANLIDIENSRTAQFIFKEAA